MSTLIVSLLFLFSFYGDPQPLLLLSHPSPWSEIENKLGCISLTETCALTILPDPFATTSTSCPGASNGAIFFNPDFIINGTPPYYYDWDDLSTPNNDAFSDDGIMAIDSIPAGYYSLIVTDAEGCTASASAVVEQPFLYATTEIDSVGLCNLTGGIQIVSYFGPPYLLNYNWDFAFTPEDDDYGSGVYGMGFPPAQNDQEDLMGGLEGGTYFLEMTLVYDSMYQEINCVWRDTFNIFNDSLRIVCPSGDAYVYAGVAGTTITYQWQIDSLNGFEDVVPDAHHAGTSGPLLYLTDMPSSRYGHQYRCRLIHEMDTTFSDPFILRFGVCWDGSPNNWDHPSAWHCNIVPDAYTDVLVTDHNSSLSIFTNAICRSLTLFPGSNLHIIPPAILTIEQDP